MAGLTRCSRAPGGEGLLVTRRLRGCLLPVWVGRLAGEVEVFRQILGGSLPELRREERVHRSRDATSGTVVDIPEGVRAHLPREGVLPGEMPLVGKGRAIVCPVAVRHGTVE